MKKVRPHWNVDSFLKKFCLTFVYHQIPKTMDQPVEEAHLYSARLDPTFKSCFKL